MIHHGDKSEGKAAPDFTDLDSFRKQALWHHCNVAINSKRDALCGIGIASFSAPISVVSFQGGDYLWGIPFAVLVAAGVCQAVTSDRRAKTHSVLVENIAGVLEKEAEKNGEKFILADFCRAKRLEERSPSLVCQKARDVIARLGNKFGRYTL